MSRKDILNDIEEGFDIPIIIDDIPIQLDSNQEDLYQKTLSTIELNDCMDQDQLKQIQLQSDKEQDLQYQDIIGESYIINDIKYRSMIWIKSILSNPHSELGKLLKKEPIIIQFIQINECDYREKIEKLIMHNNRDDKMFQYLTHIQNKKKRKMSQINKLKHQIAKSNIICQRKNANSFIEINCIKFGLEQIKQIYQA